jgi:phosphatidylserine/phosphatidylglycerophosphate/cardiolipin synthase-like enzyme
MANTSVTGIILDGTGLPWVSLNVDGYDNDALGFRDKLGSAITDGTGRFRISYSTSKYGPIEKQPDIQIEVWNVNRTVFMYKTREFPDIAKDELDIGTIQIGSSENTSLSGRVIDENNQGIAGLVIIGYDTNDSPDKLLGRTITDGQGRYGMAYSPTIYGWKTDPTPDLMVQVFDRVGVRMLAETQVFYDVAVPMFTVPDIQIQRVLADGWLITLGGAAPTRFSTNNQVEVLVDSETSYKRMVDSINNAKKSIWILQLAFEPDTIATYASPAPGPNDTAQPVDILADAILQTDLHSTAGAGAMSIKILLNANVWKNTSSKLRDFFVNSGAATNRITVRGINAFPLIQHAKMMLIDGEEAYILGFPFEDEYWDSTLHRNVEPRRPKGALKGRPAHTVSLRITGKAMDDLEDFFIELWNDRDNQEFGGRDNLSPHRVFGVAAGGQSIQVVRTVPAGYVSGLPSGEMGVLEAYRRAIAEAQTFIYLEHQYFSARPIFESLYVALQNKPALQVIMLINENPDIPTYKGLQNNRLKAMGYEQHPRLGVFTLWSVDLGVGAAQINQVYVESKVAIVDDKWATIGTANLDGVSQQSFDWPFPGHDRRNFEVNTSLFDGIGGQPATGNVALIRKQLWSEHLGLPQAALLTPPAGGWLQLWRDTATANVTQLNTTTPPTMTGHILRYSRYNAAKDQLNDAGVNISPNRLRVLF